MRRLSIVFAAVFILGLLAACGGGSKTPATSSSATGTASAATSVTTSASPSAQILAATPSASPTAAMTGTPVAAASPTVGPGGQPSGSFAYGFNVFFRGDDNGADYNKKTINAVQDAGFNWVRVQIPWDQFERAKGQWDPLPIDRMVEQFHGANVKILASVVKPPTWALDPSGNALLANYSDFQDLMQFLSERYKGKIGAWEIWNEENLASEMNGHVRVQDYGNLLEAGYNGVRQGDPGALVVFGGLTPTGVDDPSIAINDLTYLKQFYALKDGYYTKFFDLLGMHVSATNNPPDKMYPDDPGTGKWSDDPSFYFRRAEQLHQVMVDHNDVRIVWITEFGWTTKNEAKGYEYGADNSPQEQADYLVGAFEYAAKNWPWTTGMFVWNLNYSTVVQPDDEKYPWSVLNADWSPRPAYTALQKMPKR